MIKGIFNCCMLISMVLLITACNFSRTEFYVSPTGSDKFSGTLEKPFLTVQKALDALPENISENFVIHLADGNYFIDKPLLIGQHKIAGPESRIFLKAEKDATPVISGGKLIQEWQRLDNGLWETKVKSGTIPQELFAGNKRCVRARFPNDGFLRVKKVGEDRRTNFFFEEGDFPVPLKPNDVELVLLHDWSISRIGIKEIDFQKRQLTAVDWIGTKTLDFFKLDGWEQHPRYFLENDRAFLDADFEWYFDPDTENILLKLPSGQNPEEHNIAYSVSESLVFIEGTKEEPVRNISFDGITFRHSAWITPAQGYCGIQACFHDPRPSTGAWAEVPAAIKAEWAENILFNNCNFEHLGGSGLRFSTGCKNCSVKNSVFFDIAGNGIMIGEGQDRLVNGKPWWQESPEDVAVGNSVENCTVTQCGIRFFGAVGIWCGLAAEISIKYNHIYDLPYTGISVGWMWSPVPTPCRANIIDGNHIHNIMNVLSDGGGIYMLGLQPGSKLVNNHIHDVKLNAGRAESNGMFLDEGTTEVLIANNLIYNIAKSPLRFHKATTNLVKENYLFCKVGNPPVRYNRTNEEDIQKADNMVLTEGEEGYVVRLKEMTKKLK